MSVELDECIDYVRNIPLERLRDEAFLENEFLLRLGLNNEILHEFPRQLYPYCGRGLKSWQYPNQFSKYLNYLSQQSIHRYLEIGCRHGGTFIITVEYLRRFNSQVKAVAVDIEESVIMRNYTAAQGGSVEYYIESSRSDRFKSIVKSGGVWDLVLIDGDHSFEGCLADYISVKDDARAVALHDVVNAACPGVQRVWGAIKMVHPNGAVVEFLEQYQDVLDRTQQRFLGMGVVKLLNSRTT